MTRREKVLFGYGKDAEFISFPYDWLEPGEFRCEPGGEWPSNTFAVMCELAEERRGRGLEPIYWMKPAMKHGVQKD